MHRLHDLFSAGGSPRQGLPAGCDIRVRLVLAVPAIVAVVASTRIEFGLAALGCSLGTLAAARTPSRTILHQLTGPVILAAIVVTARAFLTGTTPAADLNLGCCRLTATREGLWGGLLIASRVLGSLGIVMVLCRGTTMHELSAALRWFRVPQAWIEIALLMYRYLHLFLAQAGAVVAAQRVRLGYGSLRKSFQSAGTLAGIVVLRSLDQARRSHEAMIARGYHGSLPLPSLPPLSRSQRAVACLGLVFLVAAYALAERWSS